MQFPVWIEAASSRAYASGPLAVVECAVDPGREREAAAMAGALNSVDAVLCSVFDPGTPGDVLLRLANRIPPELRPGADADLCGFRHRQEYAHFLLARVHEDPGLRRGLELGGSVASGAVPEDRVVELLVDGGLTRRRAVSLCDALGDVSVSVENTRRALERFSREDRHRLAFLRAATVVASSAAVWAVTELL
ncbi:hypothetical protein ACTVZO_44005 [Streptomyces sp. IBSNAI002]|uniref:hypothetical protein n=1 Tax=Streptomyces sp. IBSNAI002 TaxID=3457500 RepID=UPI003FCF5422